MLGRLSFLGLGIGIVPAAIYLGYTIAFRAGAVGFGEMAGTWKWQVPLLFAGAALLVVAAVLAIISRKGLSAMMMLVLAAASGAMAMAPLEIRKMAGTVPPIHDISTDTENPPVFVATGPLRKPTENPAAYDRGQTEQQVEAYPDLKPIAVSAAPEDAFEAALEATKAAGVMIVETDAAEGRIEGTAVTLWFGFKDDVVVRIRAAEGGGTVIDIRSKSRFGRSDLGTNAKRIRRIREGILSRLDAS